MRISDWSSDVCSSDLYPDPADQGPPNQGALSGIEVRIPCPRCEDCPLIPLRLMDDHMREHHPEATVTVRLDNSAATFTPRSETEEDYGCPAKPGVPRCTDRKSTRLNSSH